MYGQAWYLTNDLALSIYLSINSYISLPGAGLGVYGQAWYVNGDLAPDLFLVKGQKYTFIVEVRLPFLIYVSTSFHMKFIPRCTTSYNN